MLLMILKIYYMRPTWKLRNTRQASMVTSMLCPTASVQNPNPPSRIERLEIHGYPGVRFVRWMLWQHGDDESTCSSHNCLGVGVPLGRPRQLQCLTMLILSGFPHLKCLQELVELPCLEELHLRQMQALKSISGGPFPSLIKFSISIMPSLEELWTLADGEEGGRSMDHNHHRSGQVVLQAQISSSSSTYFPRLSSLAIRGCPKLEAKPYLPSLLESLILYKSNGQLLLSPFRQGQGCWSSNDMGLLSPSFDHLKKLQLVRMTAVESRSGCGWELLQHLTALESLSVSSCDGLAELPESMQSLTSLRSLLIHGCSALRVLPEWLGELRSLQEMTIERCDSLTELPQSMRSLTSLRSLLIHGCSALRVLPECLGELQSLQEMTIERCNSLTELPVSMWSITSLRSLFIHDCFALRLLPEWLGQIRSLQEIFISICYSLCNLPLSMQVQRLVGSLQYLRIEDCGALQQLPGWIGELRSLRRACLYIRGSRCLSSLAQFSLSHLFTYLQELSIGSLDALHQLPEWLWELRALRELELWNLPGLTCLPQSMRRLTSLERLRIMHCKGITSLPAEIQGLTTLQELHIVGCPVLEKRCERKKGQDWHLISHIPLVHFE